MRSSRASATLREGAGAATRAAYALLDLAAALTLERGRARGLAETQRLQAGDPARISDPARRACYSAARTTLSQAQITINQPIAGEELTQALAAHGASPERLPWLTEEEQRQALEHAQRAVELMRAATFQQAKQAFDAIVTEARVASDLAGHPADFLLAPLDLALAGAERPTPLTLRDLLNQSIEGNGLLLGLRLLILSACQTASSICAASRTRCVA